jgi:transcriptional regulator with XRE-family HTH domain
MTENDLLKLATVRAAARSGEAKELRVRAGLSQAEIAEACGVRRPTVGAWESGTRSPHGDAALAYARVLGRLRHAGAAGQADQTQEKAA